MWNPASGDRNVQIHVHNILITLQLLYVSKLCVHTVLHKSQLSVLVPRAIKFPQAADYTHKQRDATHQCPVKLNSQMVCVPQTMHEHCKQ
jgi:hypothetical protein